MGRCRPSMTLTGRSPRPRPSRKISDHFRTGVSHRKHFEFSMTYIWNEIVDFCINLLCDRYYAPVVPNLTGVQSLRRSWKL
jgi:hypothetical protein